jgi:hypothetical protein
MQIKKLLAPVVLPLTVTALFGLAACGGDSSDDSNPANPSGQVTPADTSSQSNPTTPTDTSGQTNPGNQTGPGTQTNPEVSSSSQAPVEPPVSSAQTNLPPTSSAANTTPESGSLVALATTVDAAKSTELYASWKSWHFVTLEEELTYYPDLADDVAYVFSDAFKPAGRVIWQTGNQCKNADATKPAMKSRACTVSEGTGYGMVLSYFNNDKDTFNRIWNYSRAFRDYLSTSSTKMYLTPWITYSFMDKYSENSSATDADLDIATSLVLMYYKTQEQAYLTDALNIMGAIWDMEVNPDTYLIYSGDAKMWKGDGAVYNLSYFSPVALRLFAKVDTQHEWNKVLDAMYTYMQTVQDKGTGVFPDWSNGTGVAVDPNNGSAKNTYWTFNKEAVRIPWRIAWDYYWFQDERDLAILTKLNKFISDKASGNPGADALAINYSWDPNKNDASGTVVSPQWLAAWCATGIGNNADWLNNCTELVNKKAMSNTGNSYFPDILLGLYSTLLNGKYVKPF